MIIEVLGQWWQMEADAGLKHTSPMSVGPNMPLRLMYSCNTIYNATDKEMIKNRSMETTLNDAIVMRMWLNDELPIFKWKGYKQFQRELNQYQLTLAA